MQKARASFLKKEAKNSYLLGALTCARQGPQERKFFASFLQKRSAFLA
jgi:hypothetical protein